ncbi:MAG: hypothetical protein U5K74_10945 [Gemmatimonadaceae bacterium]|nr:hypothetical protein [Gemmatimonadaceae bacterium]
MRGFSLFNLVFLAGLLVSVRVMVAGVERAGGEGDTAVVRSRWAMLAGLLTLSGFLGSVLVRLSMSSGVVTAGVLAGAVFGALSARVLVSRAAAMPVSDHEFDPRFALQGVPAMVVEPIPAGGDGLVQLPGGSSHPSTLRARSLDGVAIAKGEEVGVERIDDGVAFVEAWSAIEARL